MVMLVSLQEASDHLRRDTADDDNDLMLKIQAASRFVVNYLDKDVFDLDSNDQPVEDSDGIVVDVPFDIKAATLLIIGELYANRDAPDFRSSQRVQTPRLGDIIMPRSAHLLLDHYRTPVCH